MASMHFLQSSCVPYSTALKTLRTADFNTVAFKSICVAKVSLLPIQKHTFYCLLLLLPGSIVTMRCGVVSRCRRFIFLLSS